MHRPLELSNQRHRICFVEKTMASYAALLRKGLGFEQNDETWLNKCLLGQISKRYFFVMEICETGPGPVSGPNLVSVRAQMGPMWTQWAFNFVKKEDINEKRFTNPR